MSTGVIIHSTFVSDNGNLLSILNHRNSKPVFWSKESALQVTMAVLKSKVRSSFKCSCSMTITFPPWRFLKRLSLVQAMLSHDSREKHPWDFISLRDNSFIEKERRNHCWSIQTARGLTDRQSKAQASFHLCFSCPLLLPIPILPSQGNSCTIQLRLLEIGRNFFKGPKQEITFSA